MLAANHAHRKLHRKSTFFEKLTPLLSETTEETVGAEVSIHHLEGVSATVGRFFWRSGVTDLSRPRPLMASRGCRFWRTVESWD